MSNSLQPHGLYSLWNSPGQNTRVSSLFLLQGIFPAQGSNPCLLHCKEVLYQLSHKGILEWLAYPFSSGSSWPYINVSVKCDFAASPKKKWNLFPHPLTLVRTCGFFWSKEYGTLVQRLGLKRLCILLISSHSPLSSQNVNKSGVILLKDDRPYGIKMNSPSWAILNRSVPRWSGHWQQTEI